jgi:hypothetical protein
MNASFSMLLALITTLMNGGGNHLLDYASSAPYWKSKNITISIETMSAELKVPKAEDISPQIKDLASPNPQVRAAASKKITSLGEAILPQLSKAIDDPDPEVAASIKTLHTEITAAAKPNALRRLMAIRALGELKNPAAIPVLREFAKSEQMFAAEYANRAIAQLEAKDFTRPAATAEQRKSDIWILPAESRMIIQTTAAGFGNISIDALFDKIPMAALGNQDKDKLKEEMTKAVLMVADQVGDVRFDGITAALAGEMGNNTGFACAIVRAQYDSAAARAALARLQIPSRQVGGLEVFIIDDNHMAAAFLFPSNDRAVAIAGPNLAALPLDELTKAVQTGTGKLATVPEMKKLLDSIDTTQPLWLAAKITDTYREMPVLAPFDTLTMTGKLNGAMMDVQFNAAGVDAAKVASAVDMTNNGIQMGIAAMRQEANNTPFLGTFVKALESVKCTSQGEKATLTASVEGNSLIMLAPIFFGLRAAPMAAPPGAPGAPPPPPVQVVK